MLDSPKEMTPGQLAQADQTYQQVKEVISQIKEAIRKVREANENWSAVDLAISLSGEMRKAYCIDQMVILASVALVEEVIENGS